MSKKYINILIKEIEKYTGKAPLNTDGMKDFTKVSYTINDELEVENFIIELLGNNEARKELSDMPKLLTNKQNKIKFAKSFLGNYGPKIIENK